MKKIKNDIRRKETFFHHPSAIIDKGARIGEGTHIWHFSHILKGSRIGKNCVIGQNVMIGPDVRVGSNVKIQNNVSVYKGVTLQDDVFCGPSSVFTNVYNPRSFICRIDKLLPTLVKKGATIGANATVVCGNTIGRYAFIGAGAVVTRGVPDYALCYGNPARIKGWVCECGFTLNFKDGYATCHKCKNRYKNTENGIKKINTRRSSRKYKW